METTWKEERQKFWDEFDPYSEEYQPQSAKREIVYQVSIDYAKFMRSNWSPINLYVAVDTYGCSRILMGHWFDTNLREYTMENHGAHTEAMNYLCEMEYVEKIQIGPDDTEYFATEKLIKSAGYNYPPL